jgi:hypothetical protein
MNRIPDKTRHAIEAALEAGTSPTQIAADCGVALVTVYRVRSADAAMRAREGLPALPMLRPGRKAQPLTTAEEAIRAEYLATGERRPLARKHGLSLNRLTHILDYQPSVIVERAKRLAAAEPQGQQT